MSVTAIGGRMWSLERLRRARRIKAGDVVLTWTSGRASALDRASVADGCDVGEAVRSITGDGGGSHASGHRHVRGESAGYDPKQPKPQLLA